jgi:ribosomal protein L6P/L9E
MERRIAIPDNVEVESENGSITVSSGETVVERTLDHQDTEITVDGDDIVVSTDSGRRDVKALLGTYASHVTNMIDGVTKGFEYRMKGFYSHFPMDMKVEGDTFVISNFIGERTAREVPIPDGVDARSLRPLLVGERPDDWPDSVVAEYHGDEFGLYTQRMVRSARYKYIFNTPDIDELYDLRDDPAELLNLVDHPDYAPVRRELRERLIEWMHETADPLRKWGPKALS